jgi:hypothetical protein
MLWSDRVGSRLKLRDLRVFMAVANAGTMGRAAADLAVSQPVISKSIADLEDALGVRLFDRSRRGFATPASPSSTSYSSASKGWKRSPILPPARFVLAPPCRLPPDWYRRHSPGWPFDIRE